MWTAKGGSQWCKTGKKKNIDESEEGADISSGTLANSSNLCLKRDLTNSKHLGEKNDSKRTGLKNSWLTCDHTKG